jgi:predicted metal-dependent hydrolase
MHDAALQLHLPLFDEPPRLGTSSGNRRWYRLRDQYIDYQLRRSRRRTIGFLIDDRGLTVTAPKWVSVAEIESGLAERSDWIARKLIEWRDYANRRDRLMTRWEDGAPLLFVGEPLTMQLTEQRPHRVLKVDQNLLISLPPKADSEQMKVLVHGWLQAQAKSLFGPRLHHFSDLLGKKPRRWGLSSARTRWGSCGPDGSIRLNWRLVHFPADVIDYIIAHEVAHLREMNHGPKFWATVCSLLPGYEKPKDWLKNIHADTSH